MNKRIFIDPGHGDTGKDFGAIAKDGTREADIVLEIAKITKEYLKKKGYDVYLSREKETSIYPIYNNDLGDLPYRTDRANYLKANLFVSIHCNAVVSPEANGTEIFYASSQGQRLAKCILNEVLYLQKQKKKRYISDKNKVNLWNFSNRGVKKDSLYVLNNTDMPAVLVETLFLSNPEDLELLKSREFQTFYALAIANGIEKYLGK
jgi:N-acetylmuramoyl-L-alanine amidase